MLSTTLVPVTDEPSFLSLDSLGIDVGTTVLLAQSQKSPLCYNAKFDDANEQNVSGNLDRLQRASNKWSLALSCLTKSTSAMATKFPDRPRPPIVG
jgi:hypothetical protein